MDSVFSMRTSGKRSGMNLSGRPSSAMNSDSDMGVGDIIERMKRPRELVSLQVRPSPLRLEGDHACLW